MDDYDELNDYISDDLAEVSEQIAAEEITENLEENDISEEWEDFFGENESNDIHLEVEESLETLSDSLSDEIEDMSSKEIALEQELKQQLDGMSDEEIYDFYLLEGLNSSQAKYIRDKVIAGDEEIIKQFGVDVSQDNEEDGYQYIKRYPN